jgi:hypothetical protein
MDLFGFKRRALISKLMDLPADYQAEYDESRDAFNDLAAEITSREDYHFENEFGDNDWDQQLEEFAARSYAAMIKLELIQERIEALEA